MLKVWDRTKINPNETPVHAYTFPKPVDITFAKQDLSGKAVLATI
jgi:hypothetical protein